MKFVSSRILYGGPSALLCMKNKLEGYFGLLLIYFIVTSILFIHFMGLVYPKLIYVYVHVTIILFCSIFCKLMIWYIL